MLYIPLFMYFTILVQTCCAAFVNRYNFDLENVELCPGNDFMETPVRNLRFVHVNRTTRSISCDINLIHPIDGNVGLLMLLSKWTNGNWVNMPFLPFQPDECRTSNRLFKANWVTFTKAMGVKHPDRCPIPAGNYSIRNLIIDFSVLQIPFWNGRFKVQAVTRRVDTKRDIFCLTLMLNIAEI